MRPNWSAGAASRTPRSRRRSGLFRLFDVLLAIAILAFLVLVSTRLERFNTVTSTGVARIGDGDSLQLKGERMRLRGIDAPELSQSCRREGAAYPCGRQSRDALRRLAESGPISCEGWERDRYGRLLVTCRSGDVDLNAAQVSAGWAVAYGGYAAEEAAARRARLGLWAGEFERPSAWRVTHGNAAEMPHDWLGTLRNWLRALFDLDGCARGEGCA